MFTKNLVRYQKIRVCSRDFTFLNHRQFVPSCAKINQCRSFIKGNVLCSKSLCNVLCETSPPKRPLMTISQYSTVSNQILLRNSITDILNASSVSIMQKKALHSVNNKQDGGHKIYQETENNILYGILSAIPELNNTLAPVFCTIDQENLLTDAEIQTLLATDFANVEKAEILECFEKLSFYMYDKEDTLNHTSFDNICQALGKSISNFSDDELCNTLYLLQIWSPKCFRTDKNYFDIFSKVDQVLIERLNKGQNYYSLQQMLLLIDYWTQLNLLKSSNFCKLGLKKLLNRSHQLEPKQFVQLMFYHCKYRTFHPLISSYDIEFNFEKNYDKLSPSEIAIVLLAFFKSEKKFVNPHLCAKVAKTFINNVNEMNSVCINGYLKSMRHYFPIQQWNVLYQVCDKLCEIIDSAHHQVLPHAALVGTKIDVYHSKLIDKIVAKTIEYSDILRIKDFEKVLLPIVLFNHKLKQPELLDIISKEFLSEKRESEVNKYPKTLISLVHHLIIANHFNFQLIEKSLNMDFLHNAFGKKLSGYVIPKDLLLIDLSVEIEASDYTGPRLPESLKHMLCKHYAWRKPGELFHHKEIKSDELAITVQKKLVDILGGEKFVQLAYVLPHFIKPDVLVCLKNGKPIPVPESMSDFVHMNTYPPPATGTWYAFVFLTIHQLIKSPDAKYKGTFECKIRQLKRLGYEPIIITAFEWINETEQVREQMLRDRLGLPLCGNTDAMSANQ